MLEGLRIIEFEGLGPAPFAGMMLADLGADVVVVHKPGPPNPMFGEKNPLDRGKRSIALDLKTAGDLSIARALIAGADALIEGFRPGVMERLGLGPAEVHVSHPKLVYGRMTGWGQDGPRAHTAGHDLNYIATSGALWYASPPGASPLTPATLVGDIGGGALYLVAGVLAGMLRVARGERGTVVDAAIVDGSAHMMALLMAFGASGNLHSDRGQSLLDAPPWGRCYACSDARFVSVQCLEPKFYALFLDRIGLADDRDFQAQYDRAQWPAQIRKLTQLFASQDSDTWEERFSGSDACVARVLSPEESAQEPHMAQRGSWSRLGDAPFPAPAPRFDGNVAVAGPIPTRDGDRTAILEDLHAKRLI